MLDANGRRGETLVDEARAAGSYMATWTPKYRAIGITFYRLESGSQVAARKPVLME